MKILSVVVNYNQNLEIERFLQTLKIHWPLKDTIVVDDGSTDGSDQIASNMGFDVHRSEINYGIGSAIRRGIISAKERGYEAVVILSSNGKMEPSELPLVTEPILQNKADYVTGSRFLAGGRSLGLSLFRRIAIPIFSLVSFFFFGRLFSDITCGFRCYKVDFLFSKDLDLNQSWLNRYELEYYIHFYACKKNLRIQEVPVTIRYDHLDKKRKSKIKPIVGWWSMIRPLVFLKFHLKK